jgi:hypothetical protein
MNQIFFYPLDLAFSDFSQCEQEVFSFIKHNNPEKSTVFVISAVREEYNYSLNFENIKSLKSKLNNLGFDNLIYFVNNTCTQKYKTSYTKTIEWFSIDLLNRIQTNNQQYSSEWNHWSDKVLFLTLRSNKIHRVGLLYKFIESGLIDNLLYSFYPYKQIPNQTSSEEFYKMISGKDDYSTFADKYARTADDFTDPMIKSNITLSCGYPYDVRLYSTTCLSVVSETLWGTRNIFLTEKTWKPIINNQPFIIAGQPNTLKYLKSLGFRTFENYLKIPTYDQEEDHLTRITNLVDNTRYFLENKNLFIDDIKRDVEYNFSRFHEFVEEQHKSNSVLQDAAFMHIFFSKLRF